jgi:hypothetical protein
MTLEEKQLDRLFALLEQLEKQGDTETASALRWILFKAENQ